MYVLKGVERESNPHVFEIGKRKKKNGERLILVQCSIWYRLQQLLIINISSFFFIIRALFSILPLVVLSLSVWCVWWFIINFYSSSCHDECKSSSWGVCSVHSFCLFKDNLKFIIYFAFRLCVLYCSLTHRERESEIQHEFLFLIIDYEWRGRDYLNLTFSD